MTHELKRIVEAYEKAQNKGVKAVLVSVVALDGSSYRRPGVRMLLLETGEMIGAVSGGCVEKEVVRQAESVFVSNKSKVMVYDGRYRLGCEGILYILIEPFTPNTHFLQSFKVTLGSRQQFSIVSVFDKSFSESEGFGSTFHFGEESIDLNPRHNREGNHVFEQELKPCFQLIIIGAEHDAVLLCQHASLLGWEVTIITNPREEKTSEHFPGVHAFLQQEPENLDVPIDEQTAVVIMTHSFVKDLGYLLSLRRERPAYLGLLGPARRREKLFNEILERYPDLEDEFLDMVHGPAGIDIGAETPEEISCSILAEILAVVRNTEPMSLKEKLGKIHS